MLGAFRCRQATVVVIRAIKSGYFLSVFNSTCSHVAVIDAFATLFCFANFRCHNVALFLSRAAGARCM